MMERRRVTWTWDTYGPGQYIFVASDAGPGPGTGKVRVMTLPAVRLGSLSTLSVSHSRDK